MNRCKAVLCLSNKGSALSWGSRGWYIPLQGARQNVLCFSPGTYLVAQHSSGTSNTPGERQKANSSVLEEKSLTGAESQIVEFGKQIWRSSNPAPLLSYTKFLQILLFTPILKISPGIETPCCLWGACSAVQSLCQ